MTGSHHEDPRLRELLSDAVGDVDPEDRITSIRNRTKVTPMTSRRPWLLGAGGAVAATAAVITAVAFVGGNLGGDDDDPAPAASGNSSPSASQDPSSQDPSETTAQNPETGALAVYYVGTSPQGPRLFREFRASSASDELLAALSEATAGKPLDPDYHSMWPEGEQVIESASVDGDVIRIELSSDEWADLPGEFSEQDASLAVQQLVYTAQGVTQGRKSVQFEVAGEPADQVFGVNTSEPIRNAAFDETVNLMSVTTPVEGQEVSGSFRASGASNGFEANVQWEILKGDEVVKDGFTTAAGWMEPKLFPWKTRINVSDLEPGEYTFRAHNEDPTGGTEGSGPHEDTKTIVVK